MPQFAWRRCMTRHFGEQWVPFADVNLRTATGAWRPFSVQVDSGAVVSVLTRSAADVLEIDLQAGEPIGLAGIAAPRHKYYLHPCTATIGESPEFTMRIAFADHEDVPNLLGRLDVLDRFQIDLDVSLEETRISAPWLDADDRRLWRHLISVEESIRQAWSTHPLPGRVDEAAKRLINRADQLAAAGAGLVKLHREFELPLIVRSLFELSVQFEYLMRDPEPRAALYLDFEHITKYRNEQAWLKLPGPVGDHLRNSSHRAEGETRNRAEFDRVHAQFAVRSDPNRERRHWYPGSLRDLAVELNRETEYDAIYSQYSAWAHGDSWTAGLLKIGGGSLWHMFSYWSRVLIQIADAKKIILSGEAYHSLVELAKGMTAR